MAPPTRLMSAKDRVKWDRRYSEGDRLHDGPPSGLLVRWIDRLPRGRALDVACGLGRHARFLARHGYQVDAVDISPVAVAEARRRAQAENLRVHFVVADLDTMPLPAERYDLIVCTFFLMRSLFEGLMAALRPGGALLYETHVEPPALDGGEVGGPSDAAHYLRSNELLRACLDLRIVFYEETVEEDRGRRTAVARLVAFRPPARAAAEARG
ncbi:MAG: class I SAM-dependent methyltransferase [Armatimonadetes bacterium]|nr:class I SAM-dependent methyltransferase [Armatimonadota bacterium]